MCKNNIKKSNTYNVSVINHISEKRGYSKQYIRQCIRGDRNNLTADKIKKEYQLLLKKIEFVMNSDLKN